MSYVGNQQINFRICMIVTLTLKINIVSRNFNKVVNKDKERSNIFIVTIYVFLTHITNLLNKQSSIFEVVTERCAAKEALCSVKKLDFQGI